MSEDIFFNKVRSTMGSYSPEVPASVYSGMRRKLWLSHFVRLDMTRFNMWYLLLIGGLAAGSIATMNTSSADALKANTHQVELTSDGLLTTAAPEADTHNSSAACVTASAASCEKIRNTSPSNEQPQVTAPVVVAESNETTPVASIESEPEVIPAEEVKSDEPVKKAPKGRALEVKRLRDKK